MTFDSDSVDNLAKIENTASEKLIISVFVFGVQQYSSFIFCHNFLIRIFFCQTPPSVFRVPWRQPRVRV